MTIEHVMRRTGRIIAADQGVDIVCRGVDAYCTKDRKVVIPSIDHYAWLGENAERMLHGLLDHEVGHARDTDFKFVEMAYKRGPAFKNLMNALEDGYIEARMGSLYRGCRHNLEKKNRWFWEHERDDGSTTQKRIAAPPDLWAGFLLAVTTVVRPHGGREIADIEPLNARIAAMLREVEPLLMRVRNDLTDKRRASGEVFKNTERIYDHFPTTWRRARRAA